MVATYSELGQEERARKNAVDLLTANPNWKFNLRAYPYKNQSDVDQLINAWRKAGLITEKK